MTMTTELVLARTAWEQQVDDLIESFEQAQLAHGQANVSDFLPDLHDPEYSRMGVELLCVDLQYGWRRGQPKPLTAYVEQFPELLANPLHLAELAYEDYRMRRLAGQDVSRDSYCASYAIDTREWPDDTRRTHPTEVADAADDETLRVEAARLTGAVQLFPQVGQRFLDFELVDELGAAPLASPIWLVNPSWANDPWS